MHSLIYRKAGTESGEQGVKYFAVTLQQKQCSHSHWTVSYPKGLRTDKFTFFCTQMSAALHLPVPFLLRPTLAMVQVPCTTPECSVCPLLRVSCRTALSLKKSCQTPYPALLPMGFSRQINIVPIFVTSRPQSHNVLCCATTPWLHDRTTGMTF